MEFEFDALSYGRMPATYPPGQNNNTTDFQNGELCNTIGIINLENVKLCNEPVLSCVCVMCLVCVLSCVSVCHVCVSVCWCVLCFLVA